VADELTDDLRDVAYETDLCWRAAAEIERLAADVEQLRLNLANARTGRALLDLEHLRHDYADLHWRFTKLAALCEKILNEQWQDIMGGDGTRPTPTLPDSDQTT
jgi:hypothetical protein